MRPSIRAAMVLFSISIGAGFYSCSIDPVVSVSASDGEGTVLPDGTEFTRSALLEAFGACILSEIEALSAQSRLFAQAADTNSGSDQEQLDALRSAWADTMDIWQRLEVMQVGPAGRKTQPGGKDFRDAIYPWPHRDRCELDQNVVSELYSTTPDDLSDAAKGLWAAEYLLFYTGDQNACAMDDPINVEGTWAQLDGVTRQLRRINYAAVIANSVSDSAAQLLDAWSPDGGQFFAELTQAGSGSRTYGKKRVAINAVSDALGYVEWGIKDNKLGWPLGLFGCDDTDCSDGVEAPFSRRSKEHIRNNLRGFRKLFKGCGPQNEGLGFDDYLRVMGAANLAVTIERAEQRVVNMLNAIEEPDLVTALDTDPESVLDLHEAVGTLSVLLRTDFLVVLNLELPQMVQGDND